MKNVNRDYLVKVDAKTAAITPPRDMKFFITDIYTCNIFFQLTINDTSNSFTNAPDENASDYELVLRIVKPNNEYIDNIKTTFMYQSGNAFYYVADLEPGFTNFIGIYQCELFIKTMINGRPEISTTEPFQYEVEKSIFSDLDEVIEGDPNYPSLIDSLATKDYVHEAMKNVDLYGYATREYVNQVVVGGDIDLSDYVTDEELNGALADKANSDHTHDNYATKSYVDDAIANADIGGDINLDSYVTDEELAEALINFSGGGSVDLSNYITEQELSDALANISSGGSTYDDSELRDLIVNKADKGHTHSEYATQTELNSALGDIESLLGGI